MYNSLLIVHPCDQPDKGGCNQTCTKNGNKAVCSCSSPGFKLNSDGKSCDTGQLCYNRDLL